jgi:K+-transporting ATPase ATPase C chain
MRRDLVNSILGVVVLTVALGLLYPLAVTGISQVAFPSKADGSRITENGKLVGSSLIGQNFGHDPKYFHSRPSATGYDPSATFFGNLGPNSRAAEKVFKKNVDAYLKTEGTYDHGLTADQVPVDAITESASGVDPQISLANASIQAYRVAAVRRIPRTTVDDLIAQNTDGRSLGLFGEPGVNVLELNLALDQQEAGA